MIRQTFALVFLVLGAVVFLGIFLTESGRDLFPSLWEILSDPSELPGSSETLAISAFLLLILLTLTSPVVAPWLAKNRLMRVFFRVLSAMSTTILTGCAIAWHDTADAVLFVLVASAILNLIGLLSLKGIKMDPSMP